MSPTPVLTSASLRRDLEFQLFEWLKIEDLVDRARYAGQSRHDYEDILAVAERIAMEQFAPHNRSADADEPHMVDGQVRLVPEVEPAVKAFAEAGLIGAGMEDSVGGLQLPTVLVMAAWCWFYAANAGSAAYPLLTAGAANLLLTNADHEQIAAWVPPMVDGRFMGTMCLSEPQAGSSLSDITTRAEPQDDGTFRVFGTKMWISAGDHEISENIVHLVLAKIPGGPAGVKGISLFIVPKFLVDADGRIGERNDVVLAGVNHKMGYRGSVNTVLGFGEAAHEPLGRSGAVGYLVGEPHHGLSYMFRMMNEARIGVGLCAVALGYVAYEKSVRYAMERPQGRPATERDPSRPQVPIIEHADVRRMLLAQKSYVEGGLALVLYCSRLYDESETAVDPAARDRAHLLLELLTPITKSWPSQWCLEANALAIQIHGGYGYTREYDVEQHYRDNRLNAIHEGTHGIQGLDLLGRKVKMNGGQALGILVEEITTTIERARAGDGELAELGEQLQRAVARVVDVTATLGAAKDVGLALANATVYLEAVGHVVVAWLWLDQFLATVGQEGAFYDGKRQATRFFFSHELPRISPQLDVLQRLDRSALDMRAEWF
jgi:alkylation response protein AidB-like acyl-CoA dehydrogenase